MLVYDNKAAPWVLALQITGFAKRGIVFSLSWWENIILIDGWKV
jgi:hypothetical protein